MTKKLAGAAKGTALWVSSVSNEVGQVLISVLTAQEGPGLDRMVSGLIRRYSEAGVDRMVSGLIRRYSQAGVDRMVSGLIRRYSEAGVDRMVSGLIRRYSEAGVDRMVSGLIRRYSEAGVDRMVSGLIRRYSEAGVAPPILLYVDCGCCEETGGESELKARFGGWPDLVIRLDVWHFLRRLAAGCTTDAHALYPVFMATLSVFEWDPEDVALLRHAKREELRREGVPGISEALVDSRLTKAQLALYCRRRTRGEEAPVRQVEALLQELMGDRGWDLMGVPLLDRVPVEQLAVDENNIPGLDRVDRLAEDLVGLRSQTSLALSNRDVGIIVGLWEDLLPYDQQKAVYHARHQDRLLTGRFSWGLKTEYSIAVGSGFCLGLQGGTGSDIDSMGFLFINAIKSSVLTDMTYPSLAMYTPQGNKEYIKSVSYHNGSTADQEHKCAYSRSVTKSTTWSNTVKIESTVSMSVKAGIPGVAEVSGGFSVTVGEEQTSSMTYSATVTESDEIKVTVPAGKTVKVEVSVGRAVVDLPYSATVKIRCLNGSELHFQTTGRYIGVAYTAVDVKTTESDKVMNSVGQVTSKM
ncbi:unnamed protein product [Gadus morhua 'NCC']